MQTVGAVPVGLTRFRRNSHYQIKLDMRPYRPEEAAEVIDQVEGWQRRLRKELGTNFVFLSDEWYIMTGREMPSAKEYEGYPQLENGMGMVRQLLDESSRTARKMPLSLERPVSATLVCGEMPAPFLERALRPLREIRNLDISLLPVKEHHFRRQRVLLWLAFR